MSKDTIFSTQHSTNKKIYIWYTTISQCKLFWCVECDGFTLGVCTGISDLSTSTLSNHLLQLLQLIVTKTYPHNCLSEMHPTVSSALHSGYICTKWHYHWTHQFIVVFFFTYINIYTCIYTLITYIYPMDWCVLCYWAALIDWPITACHHTPHTYLWLPRYMFYACLQCGRQPVVKDSPAPPPQPSVLTHTACGSLALQAGRLGGWGDCLPCYSGVVLVNKPPSDTHTPHLASCAAECQMRRARGQDPLYLFPTNHYCSPATNPVLL